VNAGAEAPSSESVTTMGGAATPKQGATEKSSEIAGPQLRGRPTRKYFKTMKKNDNLNAAGGQAEDLRAGTSARRQCPVLGPDVVQHVRPALLERLGTLLLERSGRAGQVDAPLEIPQTLYETGT
jgi:hypothetical protein